MAPHLVTLFGQHTLIRLTPFDAIKELRRAGCFSVFLEFIDPRTDCLVQKSFTFYPKEQPHYAGGGFLAEHAGLPLRIPSDINWYLENQRSGLKYIDQQCTVLMRGEYQVVNFKLGVSPDIRVNYDFVHSTQAESA